MRVKVTGQSTAAFVSKEVALGLEVAVVLIIGLTDLELFLDHEDEKLLGVNL